ncbi:MAG: inositol monophosphatase family protein [Candidatus Pacebacteria bacterium]|nr:inositol monophosphatase family protein [Candidatus Paceibacterota bacterium]
MNVKSALPQSHIDALASLGLELAAAGRVQILKHYRREFTIEDKPDLTPVTIADRNAEAAIRKIISQKQPNHGVMGEEYGNDRTDAEFVWVLDPIDGTKSFMTGKPLFGCLIALCQWGRPILGVMDMPALDEVWLGGQGLPATLNGRPVRVRNCSALDQAVVYATTPDMFLGPDQLAFARVKNRVKYILYGADCYGYATVAAGWADAVVEASLKPYDYLACAAVVTAAGGYAADWNGKPLTLASADKVVMSGSVEMGQIIVKTLQS